MKRYYLNKYLNYLILFFLVLSIGLVFGFKHTTFNIIETFKLPSYFYTIGYISIPLFLVAFLVEMFSKISFTEEGIEVEKGAIFKEGSKIVDINNVKYTFDQVSSGSEMEGRNIWRIVMKNGSKKSLFVLLNYDELLELKKLLSSN